jgi:hypothetical protein
MNQNREDALNKLLRKHPLHRSFIGKVLNDLAEENIRTSIKQAFLGCNDSELIELADYAHGFVEVPPVIVEVPVTIPAPVEVTIEPVNKGIATVNEGKSQGVGKSNSKAKTR